MTTIEEFILAEEGMEDRLPMLKMEMLEMDDGTWRIHVESFDELTTMNKSEALAFARRLRSASMWILKAMEHLE